MKNDDQAAITAVLSAYIAATEDEDLEAYSQAVVHDDDVTWIGTGEADWLVGYEPLEHAMQGQFDALDNTQIEVSDETIHVPEDGQWAWATNKWLFNAEMDGKALAVPVRATWILEKRDGEWVIVHFHKSVGG